MGCAPSQASTSILVEQKPSNDAGALEESWRVDSSWLNADNASRKELFEIPDDDEDDNEKSTDSFLQVNRHICT